MKSLSVALGVLILLFSSAYCPASILPEELSKAQLSSMDAQVEFATGSVKGALIVPNGPRTSVDGKYSRSYHGVCYGYLYGLMKVDGEPVYSRRFIVHVTDLTNLTFAKQTAKFLLLLLWENSSRLKIDHPVSENTVEVWITGEPGRGISSDVAGEQFKNQIYLYDIKNIRSPTEWAREISHEYGHFALPQVSGFRAPENWANGVLGERLFLKWIADDLRAGKIIPAELPNISENEINIYIHRQVDPLIFQISTKGVEEKSFLSKDAKGMDLYTGFVLFFDTVYGSKALKKAIAACTPKENQNGILSEDFYRGALFSLRSVPVLDVYAANPSSSTDIDAFWVFIPRGKYKVTEFGGLTSWYIDAADRGKPVSGKTVFNIHPSGWWNIRLQWKHGSAAPHLLLEREPGSSS